MKLWKIIVFMLIGILVIPVMVFLVILILFSNACHYPSVYMLSLVTNTEEFDYPYLNKTDFNFDTFPTLKNAMRKIIDLDTLIPTGIKETTFDNCDNEVGDLMYNQEFMHFNDTEYYFFAFHHYIFEFGLYAVV